MSDAPAYTLVTTPVVAPTLVGTANQISMVKSIIRLTAFGHETVETYHTAIGQEAAARAFMDDCLLSELCMDAQRAQTQGENIEIEITWAYDRENTLWTPGADPYQWDFDVMDTSQALSSHPYFARRSSSFADSNALIKELGACDERPAAYWLDPKRIPSPTSPVQAIMGRYAALINGGVQEWQPIFIMLQIRHRLFPSQITDGAVGDYTWGQLLYAVNQVMDLDWWEPPAYITAAVTGLSALSYPDTGALEPELVPNDFVWIRQKPQVRLSGKNANGPSDVIDYLLGMQSASKLLFPPYAGLSAELTAKLWDPTRDIDHDPLKA